MKNIKSFQKMKKSNEKITMITAYDYPSAKLCEQAGIDTILVGDSLGMVILGYENTLNVTIDDIIHHTKAVRRGAPNTFIIADMPYASYHISPSETRKNALKIITQTGANALKIEGGSESRIEAIKNIVDCEIPVVAHLGLTPQSINKFGSYSVQGKKPSDSINILNQAKKIELAGAFMLVLEGIPELLGKKITQEISIPTVGIGAGRYTDGQVLVYHDLLGLSDLSPKFVKQYSNLSEIIRNSIKNYITDVKNSFFPTEKHIY